MTTSFQELIRVVKKSEKYDVEVLRDNVSDQILFWMKRVGVSKSELAQRLGKSRAYVTKILQGNTNFTIESLVQIARALGCVFVPSFTPSISRNEFEATQLYVTTGNIPGAQTVGSSNDYDDTEAIT
jgi:transcriptional regulator with XRE-family HTH domain